MMMMRGKRRKAFWVPVVGKEIERERERAEEGGQEARSKRVKE